MKITPPRFPGQPGGAFRSQWRYRGAGRVAWMLSPAALEVLVSDGGGATRPHPAHPSLSSIGGRGLTIVEHLCSSWGVRGDERGTTVWAVLPAPRGSAENEGRANGASRR